MAPQERIPKLAKRHLDDIREGILALSLDWKSIFAGIIAACLIAIPGSYFSAKLAIQQNTSDVRYNILKNNEQDEAMKAMADALTEMLQAQSELTGVIKVVKQQVKGNIESVQTVARDLGIHAKESAHPGAVIIIESLQDDIRELRVVIRELGK